MEILKYPHPILRKKCQPVKNPSSLEIKHLAQEMIKTMRAHDGMGLAAPQVGKSLQLCVIEFEGEVFVLINPEIKKVSQETEELSEGCLSFPGKFLPVKRPLKIKIRATDFSGRKYNLHAKGILARAIQHEIDHLNGKLFIDLVSPSKPSKIKQPQGLVKKISKTNGKNSSK